MGLGGLLEFFCNSEAFSPVGLCQIMKKQVNTPEICFLKKESLSNGLVVDSGKNCVAH
jgi:hypothetical protein